MRRAPLEATARTVRPAAARPRATPSAAGSPLRVCSQGIGRTLRSRRYTPTRVQRFVRDLVDWIELPSTTGAEADYANELARVLRAEGFDVELQEAAPGRTNVFARAGRPEVLFCTHLDTVPPHIGSRVADGFVFGRGACDAKGQAAAMLEAGRRLLAAGERRFGYLFTVGEERDSIGAKVADRALDDPAFRDRWQPRYTIVGEPTGNRFVRGHKGLFYARLEAAGVMGHSSQAVGPSAIHELVRATARILELGFGDDPDLGQGTLNVGTIGGGLATNVVAPHATCELLARIVEEPKVVEARIRGCLGPHVALSAPNANYPPVRFHVPAGEPSIAVAFGTDAPHMRRFGTPLLFGAGAILDAHTEGEKVGLAELEACAGRHVALVRELLVRP
jgi:acetylornithine deacetylase